MTDLAAVIPAARELIGLCTERRLMITTGESCTGGLIAAALTEIPGSSAVVDRGLVTYSNAAKTELLGVPAEMIQRVGAVSPEVARAMAEGALKHSPADLAVAVTGVAGPDGGTEEKPVGLVYFAALKRGGSVASAVHVFEGYDRSGVRLATVREALAMLKALL